MKTYFRSISCPNCGKSNDIKRGECTHCKGDLGNPDAKPFRHHLIFPIWKEALFFALAVVGLSVIATIVQSIQLAQAATVLGPSATREELLASIMDPSKLVFVEFAAYGTIFTAIALLIWSGWKSVGKSFAGWKPYVFGLAGFGTIIVFELVYGQIMNVVAAALGVTPGSNNNQNTLVALIGYAPALCLLFFGILGPFVEEFAYRVGLFGLGSRLGKPLGYIFTILVFALIHFDYQAAFDFVNQRPQAILEWLNLPVYMFSGAAFCFLYDKVGFGASYFAHMLNNVFSISMNIIGAGQ